MDSTFDAVIIGGGVAGITAAESIREETKEMKIGVITNEPHLLYSRVLLPSYLKQRIKRSQVFMRTPDDFDRREIQMFASHEVIRIDPGRREVYLSNGSSIGFGKLLIASGGRVRPIIFPGADGLTHIYRLQTIDDADRLYQELPEIRSAVVVGGGFIALEFLETLALRNIPTTLLIREKHVLANFLHEKGAQFLENNFKKHGITIISEDEVASVEGVNGRIAKIRTKRGLDIASDALMVGVGIMRNTEFLKDSGVEAGDSGIPVNEYLETNIPGIFAAGDVANFKDMVLQMQHAVGNWNNAFLQGKAAGKAMAGQRAPFVNLSSYSIVNLGLPLAVLGDPNLSYQVVIREREDPRAHEEFFLKEGIIRGAVLINAPRHQPIIQKWITEQRNLASSKEKLSDIGTELELI